MDFITIIGLFASLFTATSLLPQLVKVIKEKKVEHLSIWWMIVLFTGLSLWIWYGILKKDPIIVTSNSVSLALNITLSVLMLKYKKDK